MAVSITSRYRVLGTFVARDANGQEHPTVPIRRHQAPTADAVRYRHRVTAPEDIEYLAWRLFGNGDVWWLIADANPVAFPLDLTPGESLEIPPGDDAGLVRDRGGPR
jgi:hypothetical protein